MSFAWPCLVHRPSSFLLLILIILIRWVFGPLAIHAHDTLVQEVWRLNILFLSGFRFGLVSMREFGIRFCLPAALELSSPHE